VSSDTAVAIRPGEHACCRFAHAEDRERLAFAFLRDALRRGNKVLYLTDSDRTHERLALLADEHEDVALALARAQVEVRSSRDADLPGCRLDTGRMPDPLRAEHARALAAGFAGLSVTGEIADAVDDADAHRLLVDCEVRTHGHFDGTDVDLLCQYDHGRFAAGVLAEIAAVHDADAAPELAPIARIGYLSAILVPESGALRLAGELDFAGADTLASVLDAHYHGPLHYDLEDLHYVDVTGMRALRGRKSQPLTIASASEPVRRLLSLLGWDTERDVELAWT
jgi:hypothetical protein